MTAKEIFINLCVCRDQKGGMSPSELEKAGVIIEDITSDNPSDDVISHKIYIGDDGEKVEEKIISYDHSRTFELRPDSNHFYIELLETGETYHSVIMDKT